MTQSGRPIGFQVQEVRAIASAAVRGLSSLGDFEVSGPLGTVLVITITPGDESLLRCNVVVNTEDKRRVRTLFTLDRDDKFCFNHGHGNDKAIVRTLMVDHFALWMLDRDNGPDEFLRFKADLAKSSFWDIFIADVKDWRYAAIVMTA